MNTVFNTPISLKDHSGSGYASVENCSLRFERTFSGYRLIFEFGLKTYERETPISLIGWEVDTYFRVENKSILIGRMYDGITYNDFPLVLDGEKHTVKKIIDVHSNDMVALIDLSHRNSAEFEFEAIPKFDIRINAVKDKGWCSFPHSEWINFLNGLGLDRFELISIKIPVSSSHLHKPFSEALEKIRQAESQYTRGDWNGTGASCRAAWRTLLSAAPQGQKPIDYFLAPVVGDPKRKNFAETLIKGLHDIENAAVHLEGNQKTGSPPVNLTPEDALLCLHWYASVIGYLSSIN